MRGKRAKALRRAILQDVDPRTLSDQYRRNEKNGEITAHVGLRMVERAKKIWNERHLWKSGEKKA